MSAAIRLRAISRPTWEFLSARTRDAVVSRRLVVLLAPALAP